jgi:hypothetical protein
VAGWLKVGQELSEDEIKLALEKGLIKMREGIAITKGLLTSGDIEAMDITIEPVSIINYC